MARYRLRSSNEGWLTSYADLITNLLIFFVLIISVSSIQTGKFEKMVEQLSSKRSTKSLSHAAEEVQKELENQKLTEAVSVKVTDSGLELSFNSGVTFATGSATILPDMEEPLRKVMQVLLPYKDTYQFAVEGHTDNRPVLGGIFHSNWGLASARALTVRQRLEQVGIPKKSLRVEAYADNKTLDPKILHGKDQETQLAMHRRVVVRLF